MSGRVVTIRYTVPVYVDVDVKTGEVIGVVVDDGDTTYDPDFKAHNSEGNTVWKRTKDRAHELAEKNEWPGWEFGW